MLECVGGKRGGILSSRGSMSGVSWHHMCYIISDNIPCCYDYRQPLVTPHFGGIFTTCELRACEGRGNKTQEECVIISRGKYWCLMGSQRGNSSQQVPKSALILQWWWVVLKSLLRENFKVKKFELSPKLEMIICELKVNFDCLFMFSQLHWKSDKAWLAE